MMQQDNLPKLALESLSQKIPVITPEAVGFYSQNCMVCFDHHGHGSGVHLEVVYGARVSSFCDGQVNSVFPGIVFYKKQKNAVITLDFNMLTGSEQAPPSSEQSSEQAQNARNQFDERMDRLWSASGAKSDAQFAKVLGIKQQSVSSARKRKQLPFVWVVEISEKFNVSSDWLLYGTGQMLRGDAAGVSQAGDEPSETRPGSKERSRRPFNPEVLREVIVGVEIFLETQNKTFSHEKKAELILVLYEMFITSGEVELDMLNRYLRLVC